MSFVIGVRRGRQGGFPGRSLIRSRPRGFDDAERVRKVLMETALKSFQTPAFGRRQIIGKSECAHVRQQLAEVLQPCLQRGGSRGQDRRRCRSQTELWVAQDLLPVRLVGHAIGLNEDHHVGGAQPVKHCRIEEPVLVFLWERRQRGGCRWPDASLRQSVCAPGGQPHRQLQAIGDPPRLLAQELRDATFAHVIVGDE